MNNNEEIWNPTRRAYETFVAARRRGAIRDKRNSVASIRIVFAEVFEVHENDTREINKGLSLLGEALDWTREQIENSNFKQKENYLRNLPAFHSALNGGNINDSWTIFESRISEQAMADLLHAAMRLADDDAETSLNSQELKGLSDELHQLIELFMAADIDDELKKCILDLLRTSEEILNEYRFRGGDALKKILELSLGKLMTKRSMFSEENRNSIMRLWDWLLKIDTFYGRITKYQPLLASSMQFFLGFKPEQ